MAFSAIARLGLELSQQENSCFLQNQQSPQAMQNGTTTRSPFFSFLCSSPESCPRLGLKWVQ